MARLVAALNRGARPTSSDPLEPSLVTRELLAWAEDAGRWDPRAHRDLCSLIDDVQRSWSRLGPRLGTVANLEAALDDLGELREITRDAGARQRTAVRVADALEAALSAPEAIRAALEDMFEAARSSRQPGSLDEESRWRLVLLAGVTEARGHDWAVIADRLRHSLGHSRSRTLNESLEASCRALEVPPAHGHSIVWIAIDHAHAWGQPPTGVVQLFDGDWLLGVLRQWDGRREGVPPELAAYPQRLPDACSRVDTDAHPNEQIPIAFARVDLGDGPVAGARQRARDTLELLLARASTLQRKSTWKIAEPVLHFLDGDIIFESAGPIGDPDVFTRLGRREVIHDPTVENIAAAAKRLEEHLPVRDGKLHDALQLGQWIDTARDAPPTARIVLSGRVLEQAANWANLSIPTLITEHLSWIWAQNQLGRELANAGFHAIMRLHPPGKAPPDGEYRIVRSEIIDEAGGRMRVRIPAVLERLDWLTAQHAPDTDVGDYLRELQHRTSTGKLVVDWLEQTRSELLDLNRRAVRTRNALVHGGPLIPPVVDSVVEVQDALGAQALEWVIDALASNRGIPEAFQERYDTHHHAIQDLREQAEPRRALSDLLCG